MASNIIVIGAAVVLHVLWSLLDAVIVAAGCSLVGALIALLAGYQPGATARDVFLIVGAIWFVIQIGLRVARTMNGIIEAYRQRKIDQILREP